LIARLWFTALLRNVADDPIEVITGLRSEDQVHRKYAAALAARMADVTTEPLEYAASLEDADVKEFATSELKMKRESGRALPDDIE
jgi:hypothetical protein